MPESSNGNGHSHEPIPDVSVETLASSAGVRVDTKIEIRLPILYLEPLRAVIKRRRMVGRYYVDVTQGSEASVTWVGTK